MKKIFRYPMTFVVGQSFKVAIPENATILSAGYNREEFSLWAEVDDTQLYPTKEITYWLAATGGDAPPQEFEFYKTITPGDGFVWHLYFKGED